MAFTSTIVGQPGVYDGIPDEIYHGDTGSLSSSGAKKLIAPSTPAEYRWEKDHPPEPTAAFDLGTAVHTLVLGAGRQPVSVDAKSWQTKAAAEQRDAARANGQIALLVKDFAKAQDMAAAVLAHPIAAALLSSGIAERSLWWEDPITGQTLRARPDWLPTGTRFIVDLKTAENADPASWGSAVAKFGYALSAVWYCAGAQATGLIDDPSFLFVAVSKSPPHLVSVHELDWDAQQFGLRQMRRALEVHAECVATNAWPGYPPVVHTTSLPRWAYYAEEMS
jgi:hypothetical protein